MSRIDRLPAIPLISNDPYFSIWMPGDLLTDENTAHWTGAPKPIGGFIEIDGKSYRYLGRGGSPALATRSLRVTPTRTICELEGAGVILTVTFWSPALPDDLDALSTPITFVDYSAVSADGQAHDITVHLNPSAMLCYDGETPPALVGENLCQGTLNMSYIGQKQQHVLGHSGDHITIDWGYLYMAAAAEVKCGFRGLQYTWQASVWEVPQHAFLMLGYDDIASINYFGFCCRAWGLRNGKTLPQALAEFSARHDELYAACEALDAKVLNEAEKIGGADYALIAAAAWRHTFAAHKLIATPEGEMAFLSKELPV